MLILRLRSCAGPERRNLGELWSFTRPANREVITWIGGGLVVVVGGVWAVVKFFAKKESGAGAALSVRADRGGVAAGGSISNSSINTDSDKEEPKKSPQAQILRRAHV